MAVVLSSLSQLFDGKMDRCSWLNALTPLYQKLRRVQKALSRKQKGSNNRHKAGLKVASVRGQITDARQYFLHKLTTQLVRENQTIVVDDLAINCR
jgi:transposase